MPSPSRIVPLRFRKRFPDEAVPVSGRNGTVGTYPRTDPRMINRSGGLAGRVSFSSRPGGIVVGDVAEATDAVEAELDVKPAKVRHPRHPRMTENGSRTGVGR